MVTAKFYMAPRDGSLHMTVQGHAGSAPMGEDLVCAGVSTLAHSLAEAVLRLYEQGMLRRYPRAEIAAGKAEVIAVPKARFFRETMMVFWMAEVGLGVLEEHFPECVRMTEAIRVETPVTAPAVIR